MEKLHKQYKKTSIESSSNIRCEVKKNKIRKFIDQAKILVLMTWHNEIMLLYKHYDITLNYK